MKQDNGISNELRELSPALAEYLRRLNDGGRRPFRVPEGYFDTLRSDVFAFIDSGLADQKDRPAGSTFKVPEGYFERLTGSIMEKIEAEGSGAGGTVIDLRQSRRREPIPVRRWTAMAASVAFFILMGVLAARFIGVGGTDDPEVAGIMDKISQEEALAYLSDNIDESGSLLSSDDLIALVSVNNGSMGLGAGTSLEDLDHEELNDYLEDNIDDLEEYLLTLEI